MPFPKIGNLAPKFALQDHEGNAVSLADFKGKSAVVVYFYPKAMTPGCTVQAQGLRDTAKALKKLNTVVLGISPDPIKKLAKFVERDALNFQLLSDEDHAVNVRTRHSSRDPVHLMPLTARYGDPSF